MFYDYTGDSRFLLGTAGYPSPDILQQAVVASGADIITVSLRREGSQGGAFRDLLKTLNKRVLPNTAGCHTVREAVTTAHMARELFATPWIKLEVIGHADTLQPDPFALVEAARILCAEGFHVFPYTTEDLIVGEKLLEAGCQVLMPWGAPIGSGQGLRNIDGLRTMRAWFKDVPLIIDAGIGAPSQAAQAMELGFDAVLLNTAVAKSHDPVRMAGAFASAIQSGHQARLAGMMERRDMAVASTPVFGLAQFS
ncbi:thiazole-phosphate synthase [Pantoea sp. PNA 14-12]|uniref:thiazole synthase n=1 Tax=Pantoea TaxID=53335 RepID=UPI00051027CE|nr:MULTISPECIES: thiazole synthase [Pantoea]KGD79910.1 thiazole synthase [Pantoea stewartii subsp. indologenes]MDK2633778.1 thiazole synthase [Pantoea stewartii subsp. indologenes]NRH24787.1 thiazole synthase [Pantoea stewartii]PXV74136.1 thiazole-phosphate synthase [Pantoea sp. PNA 03-3]TDS67783.1 thiazole-phosphate synthase [Pantoea sp. PNA 14-12]